MELLFVFASPVVLLVIGYVVGNTLEEKHLRLLESGERHNTSVILTTLEDPLPDWRVREVHLVMGSVVVSQDYYKRFVGTLRGITGGRIKEYEPLLARARREAILRMKNQAIAQGFDHVINVRIETSRLASGRRDGKGTAGIEILAYGTAVKLAA